MPEQEQYSREAYEKAKREAKKAKEEISADIVRRKHRRGAKRRSRGSKNGPSDYG